MILNYGVITGKGITVTYSLSYTMPRPAVVATPVYCGSVSGMDVTSVGSTTFVGTPRYRTGDSQGTTNKEFGWIAMGY